MVTFSFVLDGRVGGWFWRRVATVLRDAGHCAVTPTLSGCGGRKHLGSSQTHVATLRPTTGVDRFSIRSPVSLAVFSAWDLAWQMIGRGSLLRVVLRKPAT
jgi:hypothetical protein